jgi:hypothetical protein
MPISSRLDILALNVGANISLSTYVRLIVIISSTQQYAWLTVTTGTAGEGAAISRITRSGCHTQVEICGP